MPYQVDGDYLGDVERLDVRHEPDVLRLVIPREGDAGTPEGGEGDVGAGW